MFRVRNERNPSPVTTHQRDPQQPSAQFDVICENPVKSDQ